MIGDVAQPKRDAVPFKDVPHRDAKRRPGKLNEREHGVYMTEVQKYFNINEKPKINRRSNQS